MPQHHFFRQPKPRPRSATRGRDPCRTKNGAYKMPHRSREAAIRWIRDNHTDDGHPLIPYLCPNCGFIHNGGYKAEKYHDSWLRQDVLHLELGQRVLAHLTMENSAPPKGKSRYKYRAGAIRARFRTAAEVRYRWGVASRDPR